MFYIQDTESEKILLYNQDLETLQNTLKMLPQYADLEIKETKENEVIVDFKLMTNEEAQKQETLKRQNLFEKDFIETIWGWYRKQPQGYANAPQSIDIIDNIVTKLGGFTEQVADMMIFYKKPDFKNIEQCTEEWLIANQYKHEPCTATEFMQFYIDFQTKWAIDQYQN